MDPPKVFVSYSHDNASHSNWVLKLATHLRNNGVDVIFDQWDLRLGENLPMFIEQGLSRSSFIICICTLPYTEKANAGSGGVGYEKKILSADLLKIAKINYIIPIIRDNFEKEIPIFLKGSVYINFNNDDNYNESYESLLKRIHDVDVKKKPALGKNPFRERAISQKIDTNIDLNSIKYINPCSIGKGSFDYKANNGCYIIGEGEFLFATQWTESGNDSIYCYKDKVKRIGYNSNYNEFPPYANISDFDFSSRCRSIRVGEIVILENEFGNFAAIKVTKVVCKLVDSGHLLEFEYKIYNSEI